MISNEVAESLRRAFELLSLDEVNLALEHLDEIEDSIGEDLLLESNAEHYWIMWIQLQRALVLYEVSDLVGAMNLLEVVIEAAESTLLTTNASGSECVCELLATASTTLAEVMAAQGLIHAGVNRLTVLNEFLRKIGHVPGPDVREAISNLVNMWGSYLGYDSLEKRLILDWDENLHSDDYKSVDHWRFPIPLRGEAHSLRRDRVLALVRLTSENGELRIRSNDDAIQKLRQELEEWRAMAMYSIESNGLLANFLLAFAEHCIEIDDFDSFTETMDTANLIVSQVVNDHSDDVFFLLRTARWLCSLSRTIVYHSYQTEESYQHYYWFGANCLATARNLLQAIENVAAVNQAIGLRDCIATNLAALENEMISKSSEAFLLRGRRDRMLAEILLRDPDNDLGKRLNIEYAATIVPIDPEIEREIANLNWSIVAL